MQRVIMVDGKKVILSNFISHYVRDENKHYELWRTAVDVDGAPRRMGKRAYVDSMISKTLASDSGINLPALLIDLAVASIEGDLMPIRVNDTNACSCGGIFKWVNLAERCDKCGRVR